MVSKRRIYKRAMQAFGLAIVASLALSAAAMAATEHWYVAGSKLAEGTWAPQKMEAEKGKSFVISVALAGNKTPFTCLSQTSNSTEAEVENPLGGGLGIGEIQLILKECRETTNRKCELKSLESDGNSGEIMFNFLKEEATGTGGVKLQPREVAGKELVGLETGAQCGLNDYRTYLYGQITATYGAGDTLEFTAAGDTILAEPSKTYNNTLVGTTKVTSSGSELTLGA